MDDGPLCDLGRPHHLHLRHVHKLGPPGVQPAADHERRQLQHLAHHAPVVLLTGAVRPRECRAAGGGGWLTRWLVTPFACSSSSNSPSATVICSICSCWCDVHGKKAKLLTLTAFCTCSSAVQGNPPWAAGPYHYGVQCPGVRGELDTQRSCLALASVTVQSCIKYSAFLQAGGVVKNFSDMQGLVM